MSRGAIAPATSKVGGRRKHAPYTEFDAFSVLKVGMTCFRSNNLGSLCNGLDYPDKRRLYGITEVRCFPPLFAELDPVARTKINLVFLNTGSNAFGVGKNALVGMRRSRRHLAVAAWEIDEVRPSRNYSECSFFWRESKRWRYLEPSLS
jgi:hypothetical protein